MSPPHSAPQLPPPPLSRETLFFSSRGRPVEWWKRNRGLQPVIVTVSFCTIVVHRRLGTDQCDGGTIVCIHSTLSTLPHFYVGTSSDAASTIRISHQKHTVFHQDIFHRKRGQSNHSTLLRLTQCQVLQMAIPWIPLLELNSTHDHNLTFRHLWVTHNVHGRTNV